MRNGAFGCPLSLSNGPEFSRKVSQRFPIFERLCNLTKDKAMSICLGCFVFQS